MGKYDSIINHLHYISKTHPQMSLLDRAAQFSPFAALTSDNAMIQKTARQVDENRNLSEEHGGVGFQNKIVTEHISIHTSYAKSKVVLSKMWCSFEKQIL